MPHPGVQVPGLPVPVAHNPIFPNQMSIMHEQHKILQQLAGKAHQAPVMPQQNTNLQQQPAEIPQNNNIIPAGVPQAAAQIAVENPEEQFFIQNEGTQEQVDRFANMYRKKRKKSTECVFTFSGVRSFVLVDEYTSVVGLVV